jgi:hypothetical protein
VRGEGKEKPPRIPPAKIAAAAASIRRGRGRARRSRSHYGSPVPRTSSSPSRVTFADPDHRWERSFARVKENPLTTVLMMPEELDPAPKSASVHDRYNRWILYTALSQGLLKASFIKLWNGEPGDGPAARRTWSSWCASPSGGSRSSSTPRHCSSAI